MDKRTRTTSQAHARIDQLEKEVAEIKTEIKIQFKDLFGRVKRLENVMISSAASIIALLIAVLMNMK